MAFAAAMKAFAAAVDGATLDCGAGAGAGAGGRGVELGVDDDTDGVAEALLVEVPLRDVSDFFAAARNAFATTDFPVLLEPVEGVGVAVLACF
jgi:hypothetical protein